MSDDGDAVSRAIRHSLKKSAKSAATYEIPDDAVSSIHPWSNDWDPEFDEKFLPIVVEEESPPKKVEKKCAIVEKDVIAYSALVKDWKDDAQQSFRKQIAQKYRAWPVCVNDCNVVHEIKIVKINARIERSLECPNCHKEWRKKMGIT